MYGNRNGHRSMGRGVIALCCAHLFAASCEAPTAPERPLIYPAAIEVTPDFAILPFDSGVRLTAVVRDQNGDRMRNAAVEWDSGDAGVASVDPTGFVVALGEGTAKIVVRHETVWTEVEIVVSDDPERYVLTRLYDATGGPGWGQRGGWLGSGPLSDWYGVRTDSLGRVIWLTLTGNLLTGEIPREIGELSRLRWLALNNNALTGPIPSSIGRLGHLVFLNLRNNRLTGPLPARIGDAMALTDLGLSGNPLHGLLPESMTRLRLDYFHYEQTGICVPRGRAFQRWLDAIARVDAEPCSASRHDKLVLAALHEAMDGSNWTREAGWLTDAPLAQWAGVSVNDSGRVAGLDLKDNVAAGKLPRELAHLDGLTRLDVSGNPGLRGMLPRWMEELELETLHFADTGICARPADIAEWLDGVRNWSGGKCVGARSVLAGIPLVYLTQAVQNRDASVPLIAGRDALVRVFVVADSVNHLDSDVRVTFYRGRNVVHVARMAAVGGHGIPVEVDEGRLETTHHARIPGNVLFPGVEMVVELDPGAKLPLRGGSQRRVPRLGRLKLDVRQVRKFKMTIVPIQVEGRDPGLAEGASGMTIRSEAVRETLKMLPISDYDFSVRETFHVSPGRSLLQEVDLLRIADGDPGYYTGIIGGGGVAYLNGRANLSDTTTGTMTHEFGHNMSLLHTNCGDPLFYVDWDFPHAGGRTGAWGHDRETGTLWSPATAEVMSYCRDLGYWISDFHFAKALKYRLYEEEEQDFPQAGDRDRTPALVLWGRTGPDAVTLDPAFVVDAVPSLPGGGGRYRIEGRTARGGPLFALRFDPQIEAESGEEHFVFTLPVNPAWAGSLASITVAGPNGSDRLDATVQRPIAVVTDRVTGRIRALLRDFETAPVAGPGEVVTVSRGLPDAEALRGRNPPSGR